MKRVNIAELKNRLSAYLSEVKSRDEVLVRDRNNPIAKIVPITRSSGLDEELMALAAKGKLRMGEGEMDDSFWELPAPRISTAALRRSLDQERD